MSKEILSRFLVKNRLLGRPARKPRGEKEVEVQPPQKLIPRISDLRAPGGRPDSWEPTREEKKLLMENSPEIFDVEKPKRKNRRGSKGSKTRSTVLNFTVSAEEEKIIRAYTREQNKGLSETVRTALFNLMGRCIPDRYL